MLCTFWLGNVLRATTACTFSSLIWPAGSAPAALANLLFDATFLPFRAPGSSFFWDFLFLIFFLLLFSSLFDFLSSFFFSSLLFSDSSHLCLSSVHIVGSLASKLPSTITATLLHYNTLIKLQYSAATNATTTTTTLQYATIHYTNCTTPQLQLQLHYTNYTTLQLQLTTTTPLHYNYHYTYSYNYNCATPHYIQQLWWGDHCNHCNHSRKHSSNQPPFRPSVDSLCHPWVTTTNPSYRLPILKLPPPPCTVLLVIFPIKKAIKVWRSLSLSQPKKYILVTCIYNCI